MSLAYLCDKCPAQQLVEKNNLMLPNGWAEVVMEKSQGHLNNPKTHKHLCPSCSVGMERAMAPEPGGPKRLGQ